MIIQLFYRTTAVDKLAFQWHSNGLCRLCNVQDPTAFWVPPSMKILSTKYWIQHSVVAIHPRTEDKISIRSDADNLKPCFVFENSGTVT